MSRSIITSTRIIFTTKETVVGTVDAALSKETASKDYYILSYRSN